MELVYITIFPSICEQFLATSIINRAHTDHKLTSRIINPRDFCSDPQKQVDDEIYGGGPGLLLKAPPLIDAIRTVMDQEKNNNTALIFVQPSTTIFTQQVAHELADYDRLVFVCGRYEGIDSRVWQYCKDHYPTATRALSLGTFVTMGGEMPACVMTEAIVRLIPGVLHDFTSTLHESYHDNSPDTIEHPQYTRPQTVHGMSVPDVLLSGNHAAIAERKKNHMSGGDGG